MHYFIAGDSGGSRTRYSVVIGNKQATMDAGGTATLAFQTVDVARLVESAIGEGR